MCTQQAEDQDDDEGGDGDDEDENLDHHDEDRGDDDEDDEGDEGGDGNDENENVDNNKDRGYDDVDDEDDGDQCSLPLLFTSLVSPAAVSNIFSCHLVSTRRFEQLDKQRVKQTNEQKNAQKMTKSVFLCFLVVCSCHQQVAWSHRVRPRLKLQVKPDAHAGETTVGGQSWLC